MERIGNKVLVLCSGGLDSTVLLYTAIKLYGKENVHVVSMYYGQRHEKELQCIAYHVRENWSEASYQHFNNADLSMVFKLSKDTNPMLANDAEMPEGTYEEQGSVPATYVPFRNGLFLSYATAIAYQLGCDAIAYGAHADDAAGAAYPDCTNLFIERMSQSIEAGTAGKVKLWAPWKFMTKAAVVRQGIEIGMTQDDFDHTWSCYEGGEKPCGKCATCLDRISAFEGTGFRP